MALTPFWTGRDLFAPSEDIFGSIFRPMDMGARDVAMPRPMPLDVKELPDKFQVNADIPGVKKEDIQVSVDQNMLSIKVRERNSLVSSILCISPDVLWRRVLSSSLS